jgi:hypothetical protein
MAELTGPVQTDGDLLSELGVDPQKWSIAFNEKTGSNVDEETLRAWFSNAISAGESRGYQTGLTAQAGMQEPDPNANDTNWASRNHPGRVADYVPTTQNRPVTSLDEAVRPFVDEYEFTTDNGAYSPSDDEKTLIEDALQGFIANVVFSPAHAGEPTMQERVNAAIGEGLPRPDGGAARQDARR